MKMPEQHYRASGVWELREQAGQLSLFRVGTEATLVIEGVDPYAASVIHEQFERGASRSDILEALSGIDDDPEAVFALFEHELVLRPWNPGPVPNVEGDDELARLLRAAAIRHGWLVSMALHTFRADRWSDATREARTTGLALTSIGDRILAVRLGTRGCPGCLLLRTLGRLGWFGDEQSSLLEFALGESAIALACELFVALENRQLEDGEGLWIERGKVESGPVLEHPDCVAMHPWSREIDSTAVDLLVPSQNDKSNRRESRTRLAAIVSSPFAPFRIHDMAVEGGDLPLDVPFLWGDTCLTRYAAGLLHCVSLPGMIHGAGATEAECHRLWLSEAVERLAAQSARAEMYIACTRVAQDANAALYDSWPRLDGKARPFYRGLDLLRNRPCLVPFERVLVGRVAELNRDDDCRERTFTGAASHLTLVDAALNGTVEVIVRDAFVVMWYRRRQLRRLAWPPFLSDEAARRAEFLERRGFRLELFDLRFDLPLPLVLLRVTAMSSQRSWPAGGALLIPAGGFRLRDSVAHALKLATSRYVSMCHEQAEERDPCDDVDIRRWARVAAFWPALARYLDPRNACAHSFLDHHHGLQADANEIPDSTARSASEQLTQLRTWLNGRHLCWTVVRLTDPVASTVEREVAKAVLPQLLRLPLSREEVDFQSPRLHADLPDALLNTPNPDPHPLY